MNNERTFGSALMLCLWLTCNSPVFAAPSFDDVVDCAGFINAGYTLSYQTGGIDKATFQNGILSSLRTFSMHILGRQPSVDEVISISKDAELMARVTTMERYYQNSAPDKTTINRKSRFCETLGFH